MNTYYDFETLKLETRLDQQTREWVNSENVERITSIYELCGFREKKRHTETERKSVWAWLEKNWRENNEKIYRLPV